MHANCMNIPEYACVIAKITAWALVSWTRPFSAALAGCIASPARDAIHPASVAEKGLVHETTMSITISHESLHAVLLLQWSYLYRSKAIRMNWLWLCTFNHAIFLVLSVLRLLSIWMDSDRNLKLFATNHTTFEDDDAIELASISLENPSHDVTSSNNLFAYRPRYSDHHDSGLAAVFVNLEGVFPCLRSVSSYHPICQILSDEEDGFRDGKALIGAGDDGNNFHIFTPTSSRFVTYGVAVQGCPEFSSTCFPRSVSFNIACYLPRAVCS